MSTPYLELDELAALLGYKNVRAVKRAIKQDKFEFPTYTLAGRRVANAVVVNKFLAVSGNPDAAGFLDD